jgi:hypothetical protein
MSTPVHRQCRTSPSSAGAPRHGSGRDTWKPTDATSCATVATTYVTCGPPLSPCHLNVTLPGEEVSTAGQSVPVLLVDELCSLTTLNVTLPGGRTFSLRQGDRLRH